MILQEIQAKLKAPKGQYNSFSAFYFRSCADIIEALKPFLAEYKAKLILSDDIVLVGDRYYVKATATLISEDGEDKAVGYAREQETKKGMDASQITGACSSYARKYALNGLFAIDDTKDADTQDNREESTFKELSPDQLELIVCCTEKEELIKVCRQLKKDLGLQYTRAITQAYKNRLAELGK